MAGESGKAWAQADETRVLIPIFALAVAIVAALTDRSSAADLVLIAVPVAALAAWSYLPGVPLWLIAVAVIVPVVAAQRHGTHEPLMFEVSVLAYIVGRWSRWPLEAVGLGMLAVVAPVAVALIESRGNIGYGIWILGIMFPWLVGRAVQRQAQLARELDETRRELARRAILEERRRIGRDVHDFVGHGLAAMMLQVTSARHVLRRDPAAAEEALRSAEDAGRRSMQELRRTVGLLRNDEETGLAPPVPTAVDIPALVDQSRSGGLAVELRIRGDLSEIPSGVGVAAYRIAQEALGNAARHAPRSRTVLEVALSGDHLSLVAKTSGPIARAPTGAPPRRGYGLIGMRERATALGGEFEAGPSGDGWEVSCRLPLESADVRRNAGSRG